MLCRITKISTLFFLVALLLSCYNIVHAENIGISIDKTVFDFEMDPGTSESIELNLSSLSDKDQQVKLDIEDVTMDDGNDVGILIGENELFGMRNWVHPDQDGYVIGPNQQSKIKLSVNVPNDATVGSHYCVVNVRVLPQINANNFQQTVVAGRIMVYLLVNIRGDAVASGRISDFEVPVIIDKEAEMKVGFENTGNVHYIPYGEIEIQNIFTGTVSKNELEKHFVFPGKKYSFDLKWQAPSVFGAYIANASFVDGEKKIHRSGKVIFGRLFFIFPLVLLAAVFAYFKFIKKRKTKGKNEK